ncbi:MAG TPA: MlaD family protein [Polyangiaceae bacterium]|jgi:phospholipid/cholesterol/gamma-HCH transport system substrate-binding protein
MAASKEMRVGAFVLAGMIIVGIVVFLIGDEKRAFESKVAYHTSFGDVQGLRAGAPVRLGGVDIGAVSKVAHGDDPADSRLYVDLRIVRREGARIRQDTVAKISNKGLLGDKMIELAGGSPNSPPVPADGIIQGEEPADFTNVFSQVGALAKHAEAILNNVEVTTRSLADAQLQEDVRSSTHSINVILKQIAEGKGYAHRLLADPAEAERIDHLMSTLENTAAEFQGTASEARKAVARVNEGPGFIHEVLYGERGQDALANLGGAAGEVAATLRGVREGDGLAHSVLYGGDQQSKQLADNVGAMTTDVRQIIADLRAGKGTLGALLVDPSVYEDMKSVLGNVQRNDALRALVRYSIKQDEHHEPVRVSEKPQGTSTP